MSAKYWIIAWILLAVAICLMLVGCRAPTPSLDFLGHAVVPGYSTSAVLQDGKEQVEAQRAIQAKGAQVGIDVVEVWDAIQHKNWKLLIPLLWDAVKGVGLYMAFDKLEGNLNDDGQDYPRGPGNVIADGGTITARSLDRLDLSKLNIYSKNGGRVDLSVHHEEPDR